MAALKGRVYQTWVIGETAHFLDALKMAYLARTLVAMQRPTLSSAAFEGAHRPSLTDPEEFLERLLQNLGALMPD
jgi:hypothetical protein